VRRLKSTTELVTVLFTDIVSSAAPPSKRGHASCPWARRARCSSRPRSAKRSRASTSPSPIRGSTSWRGSEGDLLLFSDPSPTEACDDFRSVATFQPWERIVW